MNKQNNVLCCTARIVLLEHPPILEHLFIVDNTQKRRYYGSIHLVCPNWGNVWMSGVRYYTIEPRM